jgi:hypothetical protein
VGRAFPTSRPTRSRAPSLAAAPRTRSFLYPRSVHSKPRVLLRSICVHVRTLQLGRLCVGQSAKSRVALVRPDHVVYAHVDPSPNQCQSTITRMTSHRQSTPQSKCRAIMVWLRSPMSTTLGYRSHPNVLVIGWPVNRSSDAIGMTRTPQRGHHWGKNRTQMANLNICSLGESLL